MPRAPGNKGERGGRGRAGTGEDTPSFLLRVLPWIVLLSAIALSAAVRVRLAGVALERDEGEYGYAGRLILEGIPPYKLAYNMKPPGIYTAYAVIMALFGKTPFGIRLGLLLVHVASSVLVFLLGRRIMDPLSGAIAGAAYALLATSASVLGPFAHASHFIVLPAMGGLLLVRRAIDSGSWRTLFGAGLLLGVAILMKQHAFVMLSRSRRLTFSALSSQRRIVPHARVGWAALAAGAARPSSSRSARAVAAGTFDRFWLDRELPAGMSPRFRDVALRFFPTLASRRWVLILWLLRRWGWRRRSSSLARAPTLFLAFSFLGVCRASISASTTSSSCSRRSRSRRAPGRAGSDALCSGAPSPPRSLRWRSSRARPRSSSRGRATCSSASGSIKSRGASTASIPSPSRPRSAGTSRSARRTATRSR